MAESDKAAEKALTKLRRLPENRICPNCLKEDSAGFTAICVPFKTFVCSSCKSAHQSFSHRVKSSTQSAWTMDEVKALDGKNGGGNRLAMELWMASMAESERPGKDGSLEAIKRFVEHVYIDEAWKSTEPRAKEMASRKSSGESESSARSGKEKKHKKDKSRERNGRDGIPDLALEIPPSGESRSTSRASSPHSKQRSHRRRDASDGWSAPDFGGAVDSGMYREPMLAGAAAWGMPGNPAAMSGPDASFGYGAAEPYVRQQPPGYPDWHDSQTPPAQYQSMAMNGLQHAPMFGQSSSQHQLQTPGMMYHQQCTPYNSHPGLQPVQSHGQLSGPASGSPLMTVQGGQFPGYSAGAASAGRSLRPNPGAPPPPSGAACSSRSTRPAGSRESSRRSAGKEAVTLHPTNPWAADLGAKLIPIEPTNPWASVVSSGFARIAPSNVSSRKLVGNLSCRSQQALVRGAQAESRQRQEL